MNFQGQRQGKSINIEEMAKIIRKLTDVYIFYIQKEQEKNHATSCLIFHKLILYHLIRFYIFSVSIKHFSWLLDKF